MTEQTPAEILESIEHLLMLVVRERAGSQTWLYDDALQEARIRAWERLEQGHPKAIAVYAARQAVIDVLRGNRMTGSKRRGGIVDSHKHSMSIFKESAEGEGYVYEPPSDAAQEAFDQIEARDVVRVALNALSERDRDIVTSAYFGDLTQAEIAQRHGCTRQAISLRLKAAMGIMRRSLSGDSLAHVGLA